MTEKRSSTNPLGPAKFSYSSRLASAILIVITLIFAPSMVAFASCYDSETNQDLARPIIGYNAKLTHICETQEAASYLVEAMRTSNRLQKEKAKAVCDKKSEFGEVTHNYGGYWYPDKTNSRRRYVEAVAIKDDLFGKQIYGVASGCGESLTQEEKLEQAFIDAEREAKALEKIRNQSEAELTVLERLAAEKAMVSVLDAMTTRITRSWVRPPNARTGLEAYFRLALSTNGEIEDVRIVRSSGDKVFDKSALAAAKRAAPFKETLQFSPRVFEEKFRTLTVLFRPDM